MSQNSIRRLNWNLNLLALHLNRFQLCDSVRSEFNVDKSGRNLEEKRTRPKRRWNLLKSIVIWTARETFFLSSHSKFNQSEEKSFSIAQFLLISFHFILCSNGWRFVHGWLKLARLFSAAFIRHLMHFFSLTCFFFHLIFRFNRCTDGIERRAFGDSYRTHISWSWIEHSRWSRFNTIQRWWRRNFYFASYRRWTSRFSGTSCRRQSS